MSWHRVRSCVAPFCFNTPSETVKLHTFPLNPHYRKEWEKVLNIHAAPTASLLVCSDHFTEEDYEEIDPGSKHVTYRFILKRCAIPSRNLRSPPHSREESLALLEAARIRELEAVGRNPPPRVQTVLRPLAIKEEKTCDAQMLKGFELTKENRVSILHCPQPDKTPQIKSGMLVAEDRPAQKQIFPVGNRNTKITWDLFVAPYSLGRSGLAPQTRNVLLRAVKQFAAERENFRYQSGCLITKLRQEVNFSDVLGRASAVTGVSRHTLRRLQYAIKNDPQYLFNADDKSKDSVAKSSDPELRDLASMRKFVIETILERKSPLSASRLYSLLTKSGEFAGSLADLRRLLSYMGFKGKHIEKDQRVDRVILVEKHKVQYEKYVYLRDLFKYKDEGRPIVYTSLIHLSRAPENAQPEEPSILNTVKDLMLSFTLVDPNEVWRAAITYAGTETKFLENTFKMWRVIKKLGSNHYDFQVTYKRYLDWVESVLIPNLPPNSVVVMDHDKFYNQEADPPPTQSATREDIESWLIKNGVLFEHGATRGELFELVLQRKDGLKKTAIQELLEARGHVLLQVPPCYWELNPMAVTLLKLKDWIKTKSSGTVVNMTPKYSEISKLTDPFVRTLPVAEWKAAARKCSLLSEEYYRYHDRIEEKMDCVLTDINNFLDTDSEEEDESSSDSEAELDDSAMQTPQQPPNDAVPSPKRLRLNDPEANWNEPDALGAFVDMEELETCKLEDEDDMEDPLTL